MDVVALKKICFITIKNQCHNMASFSYNTDDFPALPSKEFFRQSVSVYISVKPREQILYLFLTRWNHFCLKTNMFALPKRVCFLFNQMIFSILGLLFCRVNHLFVQHLVHRMHVCLLSLLSLYVTVKISVIVVYRTIYLQRDYSNVFTNSYLF